MSDSNFIRNSFSVIKHAYDVLLHMANEEIGHGRDRDAAMDVYRLTYELEHAMRRLKVEERQLPPATEPLVRVIQLHYDEAAETSQAEHAQSLKDEFAELIDGWFRDGECPDLPILVTFDERPQAELDALPEGQDPLWA